MPSAVLCEVLSVTKWHFPSEPRKNKTKFTLLCVSFYMDKPKINPKRDVAMLLVLSLLLHRVKVNLLEVNQQLLDPNELCRGPTARFFRVGRLF